MQKLNRMPTYERLDPDQIQTLLEDDPPTSRSMLLPIYRKALYYLEKIKLEVFKLRASSVKKGKLLSIKQRLRLHPSKNGSRLYSSFENLRSTTIVQD